MSTTHTDRLGDTVMTALKQLPGSLNALAKRAGVSQMLLWAILNGRRNVTPEVAAKLAAALEAWAVELRAGSRRCEQAAAAIRRAVRQPRRRHGTA